MMMINTNHLKITSLNCERTTNIKGLQQLIANNDITLLQEVGQTTSMMLDSIRLYLTIIYSIRTAIVIHHKIDGPIKVTNKHTLDLDDPLVPRVSDAFIKVNNKKRYHIIHVYYPSSAFAKQRILIRDIFFRLKNNTTPIIMGRDFNHILNFELDRQFQGMINSAEKKTTTTKESLLRNKQLQLLNAYGYFEPKKSNYTKSNLLNNRRIDRFHISESLSNQFLCLDQNKDQLIISTHDRITIRLKFINKQTNHGIWGGGEFIMKDQPYSTPPFIPPPH